MFSRVNKKLLPIKGHYFLFNAATGPVIPFLPVMARQLGFSGTIVGIIYTILPIVGMIAKPVMGGIADKFKSKKLLFILFQIVTAVSLLGINYIKEIPKVSQVHLSCDYGETVFDTNVRNRTIQDNCVTSRMLNSLTDQNVIRCQMSCDELNEDMRKIICDNWDKNKGMKYCVNNNINSLEFTALVPKNKIEIFETVLVFEVANISLDDGKILRPTCPNKQRISTICNVRCNSPEINEILAVPRSLEYQVLSEYQFWIFALLAVLGWGGMAVVVSIGDAICFEMLGDQPNLYGYQRLWGSIGWGLFSVFAGLLVDAFSDGQSHKNYTSVFYLMLVTMAVDVIVSYKLRYVQENISSNIFRDVAKVVTKIRIIVYLLWCAFVGACTALMWNFLFWHLEDIASHYDDSDGGCHMHSWIKTLEGLAQGVQCIGGELPFFFLSGWIIKRIGHVQCMNIVLLGIGVRYILYSVLINPWWVLPIELMNGITFGLFYATMASYASIAAPPGTEATVQGLVGAVFEGVGVSLGSLIGGVFMDKYQGWITFRIFGIASLICCIAHALFQLYLSGRERRQNNAGNSIPDKVSHEIEHNDPQIEQF